MFIFTAVLVLCSLLYKPDFSFSTQMEQLPHWVQFLTRLSNKRRLINVFQAIATTLN